MLLSASYIYFHESLRGPLLMLVYMRYSQSRSVKARRLGKEIHQEAAYLGERDQYRLGVYPIPFCSCHSAGNAYVSPPRVGSAPEKEQELFELSWRTRKPTYQA